MYVPTYDNRIEITHDTLINRKRRKVPHDIVYGHEITRNDFKKTDLGRTAPEGVGRLVRWAISV